MMRFIKSKMKLKAEATPLTSAKRLLFKDLLSGVALKSNCFNLIVVLS
ncbi:hypothetical protein [Helicobacter sp. 16-1353]|nr:hypothetical protein [Helicobacter sp. 16-1353]